MTPLSPRQKKVLRVRGLLSAALLLAASIGIELALREGLGTPFGLAVAVALALGALLVFYTPERRYRSWAFLETEDELHIQQGIWFKSRTVVPFGRVQHIDVSQGPVERRYGVGTLTLHTAGTRGSSVTLPGLDHEDAERMRDGIRAKIRQDLV